MVKFPKRLGKELLYEEFLFAYASIDLHTYKKVVSGFLMFLLYLQFSGSYQAFQKFLSRG